MLTKHFAWCHSARPQQLFEVTRIVKFLSDRKIHAQIGYVKYENADENLDMNMKYVNCFASYGFLTLIHIPIPCWSAFHPW